MTWTARAIVVLCLLGLPVNSHAQSAGRILVMPFENVTREGRIVWLGEAASILLADHLIALGADAITRDERRKAFEQLQVLEAASLTDATVIRIGQIVGAGQVIVGTLRLDGDDLLVQARAIALDAGRVQNRVTERGAVPDLFGIFERVARRMTAPSTRTPAQLPPNPPVAAFENYIKGLLAETPATAVSYLTAALRADSSFDRARLALWDVYDEQSEHDKALGAVVAVRTSSAWSRRARFLSGLSQLQLEKYSEAFATFKALLDAEPTAVLYNNLGVVQLRRSGIPSGGMATYYFNKATEMDGAEADHFFNLGYAYWLERNLSAAIYCLREAVRRNPADGDAHFVLGTALTFAGNTTEAAREKELARRLSSTYAEWDKRPAADAVPKRLERVKDEIRLPQLGSIDTALVSAGQRDQQELASFYLDRGRRLFQQEQDRDALTELNRAVFLAPYEAEAHLLIGRIHLRGGRFQHAIDALKISVWSADSAAAHAALAEAYVEARNVDAARTEAERALVLDPASAPARNVLDRLGPK